MRALAIGLVFLTLAACTSRQSFRDVPIAQEVPVVGIAAVPGQTPLELDGFVRAAPDGKALLRMSGGPIACEGLFRPNGSGVLYCSNGSTRTVQIPEEVYSNPNGRGVAAGQNGGRLAVGWGQSADAEIVAGLL